MTLLILFSKCSIIEAWFDSLSLKADMQHDSHRLPLVFNVFHFWSNKSQHEISSYTLFTSYETFANE